MCGIVGIYNFDTNSIVSEHEIPDIGNALFLNMDRGSHFLFKDDWVVWFETGDADYLYESGETVYGTGWLPHFRAFNISTEKNIELLTSMTGGPPEWSTIYQAGCTSWLHCGMDGITYSNNNI